MKKRTKTKVKKETIDYSSMQKHPSSPTKDTEALTKVQKWLLSTPQPTIIPKSKSIPLGLTERTHSRQVPKGTRKTRPSKSATNLLSGEKTRLQVVFKPPFRFSVKICKSDKTKVVLDKSSKPDVERKRLDVIPQHTSAAVAKAIPASSKAPKHSNSTRSNVENSNPSPPKVEKLQTQEVGDHGYANLLPRSASDCKVGKMPEVKVKGGHKKSNSVSHKKDTTESRQNLIVPDDLDNAHVYENVLLTHEAFVPKSCSMPRRQTSVGISRQSSYGHLPRAQIRPHRHSTNNVSRSRNNSTTDLEHFYNVIETLKKDTGNANTCNTNTSSSSGSSRPETGLLKASSTRQGNRTSRQNSLVDKPSRSSPIEASKSKLRRQMSEVELGKCAADMRGFQLVVGKDKLKRQLSDNELCRSRVQLAMPMSAGAEPRQAFCWNKRASLDCEASLPAPRVSSRASKRTTYTFGELKHTVPNATDAPAADDVHISPEEFLKIIDN